MCLISDAKKPYSENEPSLTYRIASVIKNPIPIPIYLIVLSFILAFTLVSFPSWSLGTRYIKEVPKLGRKNGVIAGVLLLGLGSVGIIYWHFKDSINKPSVNNFSGGYTL